MRISKLYISFSQIFLWLFCKLLVRYILQVDADKTPITPGESGKMFISNHVSHYDPFIFVGTLSWTEFRSIRPLRPMLAKGYYYSPLFLIAYPIGCYPTKPILPFLKKFAGTKAAIRYSDNGCSLGIYPEGKRVYSGSVEPKYGVIKILESSKKLDVYLIHIKKLNARERSYAISIRRDDSVAQLRNPQQIMDRVFSIEHTRIDD